MNYYEFTDPYYGLIKAESKEKAIELYSFTISELEGDDYEVNKVSRDYALLRFGLSSLAEYLDGNTHISLVNPEKIIKDFDNENNEVLLIDGCLL